MHSTEPESRAAAPGQATLSDSTSWAARVLHHHEMEGRGLQWACSFVVSKTTAIKPIITIPWTLVFIHCTMHKSCEVPPIVLYYNYMHESWEIPSPAPPQAGGAGSTSPLFPDWGRQLLLEPQSSAHKMALQIRSQDAPWVQTAKLLGRRIHSHPRVLHRQLNRDLPGNVSAQISRDYLLDMAGDKNTRRNRWTLRIWFLV